MARKNASTHSDAQLALFVNQMKDMLDGDARATFDQVVLRLISAAQKGSPDSGLEVSPATAPGNLSDTPDFTAGESAARETGANRARLMVLMGQLVLGSSNNESLLIYILMVLLQSDEPSAAIVFSTLDTTQAQLELVSRLAKIRISDRGTLSELNQVVRHFNDADQIRNEFLQAMYTPDAKGVITHTETMRLVVKSDGTGLGEQDPIDQKRLDDMVQACRDLKSLNRKIWDLLPRLQDAMAKTQSKDAAVQTKALMSQLDPSSRPEPSPSTSLGAGPSTSLGAGPSTSLGAGSARRSGGTLSPRQAAYRREEIPPLRASRSGRDDGSR